jgi:hypothetical protein
MRRELALTMALVAAACSLSPPKTRADSSTPVDTCAAVTNDLRGQSETIKQLNASPGGALRSEKKKGVPPESPQSIAARERGQVDVLNQMLPGMGCPRLDIDYELTQPLNEALLPPAPKKIKKHKKKIY